MSAHVLVIHEVDDVAVWRAGFHRALGLRQAAGELTWEVLTDGGRTVVHRSTWTSHDDARAFFESAEITALRRELGVHAPTFLYLTGLDRG